MTSSSLNSIIDAMLLQEQQSHLQWPTQGTNAINDSHTFLLSKIQENYCKFESPTGDFVFVEGSDLLYPEFST
jgi:hypothetical protein